MSHPFKRRFHVGSRKRADKRGKVRFLVVRPEEMLDLLRDAYENSPVPPDAQFFAIGVDAPKNLIQFYFNSLVSPTINCVQCSPLTLLSLLKKVSAATIPNDAELLGISVHESFTFVRLDIASDKFPPLAKTDMPIVNLRYEEKQLFVVDSTAMKPPERLPVEVLQ